MRIAMIGTGYVGLVSGVCFSEFGFHVTCVDKDAAKIARLEAGEVPIYEPGLDALIANNRKAGRLNFTTDLPTTVAEADAVFIAVGTPTRRGDGHADLTYVYAAAEEIAKSLKGYTLVVTKSTVPVGTGNEVRKILQQHAPKQVEFDVASNPEFLREGNAIEDFMRPDRVIAGVDSERAKETLSALYRPLYVTETPIVFSDIQTAELIKYAANSFLATKISFINEMALMCEKTGANIQHLARGLGLDKRIGDRFLQPGPGYGGSCFPKDTIALLKSAEMYDVPMRIVSSVIEANDAVKLRMVEKIEHACGGSVKGKTIAVLGLTFKPDTDDMRDAASLVILPALIEKGATIRTYDPQGMREAKHLLPQGEITWFEDAYTPLENADALVLLTEWNEFRSLDLKRVAGLLNAPVMVDLRNIYKTAEMRNAGFRYVSIGRPDVDAAQATSSVAAVATAD
jgi:UDPglucose 6-dehydrogenase